MGCCELGGPDALAIDASTTTQYVGLLSLILELLLCGIEIPPLRFERDIVEVFGPIAEATGRVEFSTRDLRVAGFVAAEPMEFDDIGIDRIFRNQALYAEK